ncbi:hypothetical protein [Sneathiella limimaris]|uniref:hypothetical protein n=1 Tax=Sneathiella limimaris TaxID=1964213 RepID=UPI00146F1A5B|nr:hypothetical protein [Sneathiella limimaris]
MKSKSVMTDRQMAIVQSIPRHARRVAIVGREGELLKTEFTSLSPATNEEVYLDLLAFASHLLENETIKYDAVLLLDTTPARDLIPRISKHLKPHLEDDAVLILELINPFSADQLKEEAKRLVEVGKEEISILSERADVFTKNLRDEIQKGEFFLDRINRITDQRFDDFLAEMQDRYALDDQLQSSLRRIATPSHFQLRLTIRPKRQIRIQGKVLKPVGGVNDVRMHEPLSALQSLPGVQVQVAEDQSILNRQEKGIEKIFLWQRPILTFKSSLQILLALRKAGYLIIVDFDDHPSPWPQISENNYLSFAGVHAVQTTNESLAKLIRRHNPEVGVFANQLNSFPERALDASDEPVRIFYGALNREQDYRDILPAVNSVLKDLTQPFEFVVLHDRKFFDGLETSHKKFHGLGSYEQYLQTLRTCHISFMPLAGGEFNRMKSDLKFIESAGAGAVPLASPVVYADTDPDKHFSEICESPNDFAKGLVRLVNERDYRLAKQEMGRSYVKENRMLSEHFRDRYQWYLDLLDRHTELDQALGRRLKQIVPR